MKSRNRTVDSLESEVRVVKSAARTLDIIDLLVKFPNGLSLTVIGQKLDIPLSSLHFLMATLVERDYLIRVDGSSMYRMSPKLIQLAAEFHSQYGLISVADSVMERLVRLSSEMTSLAVLHGNSIVIIHKRASQDVIQVVNPVGSQLPAHSSSLGKVMLAYLEDSDIDRLYPDEELPKLTSATIRTRTELKNELEQVQSRGYAFDNEETTSGVWAVASAVRDRNGRPVAALSIAAPKFRVKERDVADWNEAVVKGAEEVGATLGLVSLHPLSAQEHQYSDGDSA